MVVGKGILKMCTLYFCSNGDCILNSQFFKGLFNVWVVVVCFFSVTVEIHFQNNYMQDHRKSRSILPMTMQSKGLHVTSIRQTCLAWKQACGTNESQCHEVELTSVR